MIPKKPAPHLMRGRYRFLEEHASGSTGGTMLHQEPAIRQKAEAIATVRTKRTAAIAHVV